MCWGKRLAKWRRSPVAQSELELLDVEDFVSDFDDDVSDFLSDFVDESDELDESPDVLLELDDDDEEDDEPERLSFL